MLSFSQAVKIALELKKQLVDKELLDVSQVMPVKLSVCEARLCRLCPLFTCEMAGAAGVNTVLNHAGERFWRRVR